MKNRKLNKFIICALMLLAAVSCFGGYILNDYIKTPKKNTAYSDTNEENIYKPSKSERDINSIISEISDVLVKGVNRENKLVTTEINLDCEIIIDESYLDWDILKKQQALKFYATALYAVDLENFTKDDILLTENAENTEDIEDTGKIKITVYIEEPKLLSFAMDSEKTIVGKVESGLLRFGDIKLPPEDFRKIQLRASVNMTEQLHNEEINDLTRQNAKKSVMEFLGIILEDFNCETEVKFKS